MQGRLSLLGFGMGALAACAVASSDPPAAVGDRAAALSKPEAPVSVEVRAIEVRSGSYEVTLAATPRADVDYVTVSWAPPPDIRLGNRAPTRFGPTRAGQTRVARVRADLLGPGADLHAGVRVGLGPAVHPSKLVAQTLGTPPPAPAPTTRLVTLPSGEIIEEVVR